MAQDGAHTQPDSPADQPQGVTPSSLTDDEMTTVTLDRRSFLARTMVAGSLGLTAAVTAGCVPDESGSSDAASTDADSSDAASTDADDASTDSDGESPESSDADSTSR